MLGGSLPSSATGSTCTLTSTGIRPSVSGVSTSRTTCCTSSPRTRESGSCGATGSWKRFRSRNGRRCKGMTDRINGLTVTLDRDYREDDVEAIVSAIRMVRGVKDVELHVSTVEGYFARRSLVLDVRRKLYDLA